MKPHAAIFVSLCFVSLSLAQAPIGNAISYQGEIRQNGTALNGTVNLNFTLWDDPGSGNPPAGGTQIGAEVLALGTPISEGRFTVTLNELDEFGPNAFNGQQRWLEIEVNGAPLAPRQPLTMTPFAAFAAGPWKTTGANLTYQLGRVGIGVASPATPLHVLGGGDTTPTSGGNIVSGDLAGANISIDGNEIMARNNGVVSTLAVNAQGGDVTIAQSGDGNVGIGTSAPLVRLDVADRIRSRQGPGGSAGMWLYQTAPAENRAFVGMRNDTQVGLYGTEGTGWGLVMDVATGRTGVGTAAPGAKLDVVGIANEAALRSTGWWGVYGKANDPDGYGGVFGGSGDFGAGQALWVLGDSNLYGAVNVGGGTQAAKLAVNAGNSWGVFAYSTGGNTAIYGDATNNGYGVYASGRLGASGTKEFRIDHPLDPANKFLVHYCAEGPEPLNMYRGNVMLDDTGSAWVELPDYFDRINRDISYTLTPIGGPAPSLHVAREVEHNRFQIAGGRPGQKVSWRVEGVRDDLWVRANGTPSEVEKIGAERGRYERPELYGLPPSMGIVQHTPGDETPIPGEPQ